MPEHLLHPLTVDGKIVDASFQVEENEHGLSLYFACRGGTTGSGNERNTQYHIGLTILLDRLKQLDCSLTDIFLDSARARKQPMALRRLQLPEWLSLPARLRDVNDVDRLRRTISEGQRNVLSQPGRNPKHGNRSRSIRLQFKLPEGNDRRKIDEVAHFLVGDEALMATPDLLELFRRAQRLQLRELSGRPAGNRTPSLVEGLLSRRYLRLPAVVAYVLQRANGRCELCDEETFLTDDGKIYLEVHHLCHLAEGGPDTPDNAVALCPNCHREIHYGVQRTERRDKLFNLIPELVRYTPKTA